MPELGRRALFGGEFLLHVARQRPVEMRPADLQLRLQIGEDEAAVLEIEDRLAERLALAGVFDRVVEGALRRGLRADRDRKPLLRQFAHQIDEALRSEEHTSELQSLIRISN